MRLLFKQPNGCTFYAAGLEQERLRTLSTHDIEAIMTHTGLTRWFPVQRKHCCADPTKQHHEDDAEFAGICAYTAAGQTAHANGHHSAVTPLQGRCDTGSQRTGQQRKGIAVDPGGAVGRRLHRGCGRRLLDGHARRRRHLQVRLDLLHREHTSTRNIRFRNVQTSQMLVTSICVHSATGTHARS